MWYTPDQQAQFLMEKGQFAQAKDTFERKDWAAAAAYKSGDYQHALELFKDLNNEEGYYNQGNALAHLGQYEQAIKAYEKALALNPNNQDAIYNRNLIKDLLKKDKEKKQNKDQQNKDQQNKDQQNKDKQNKDQQNKDQQNKDQQNKDQQNKDQQNKDQQNKDQTNEQQQNPKQDQNKKDKEKKEGKEQSQADKEKQKAKEQWLRLIPDDPGGLMREKFLRDHLRRERGWYR
ncbi:hypothetical protein TUM19329_33770 [Legionella antarctica]|uniref:Uncharacterized protein n=1 Tax=Legionella antarctica TaxID=2708020 RepID=A0A6F8TAK8_9GAMM|nr:hypothetical protein TUM19329_33770 [Legionella antarctica]